jgi:hypothetical protein
MALHMLVWLVRTPSVPCLAQGAFKMTSEGHAIAERGTAQAFT